MTRLVATATCRHRPLPQLSAAAAGAAGDSGLVVRCRSRGSCGSQSQQSLTLPEKAKQAATKSQTKKNCCKLWCCEGASSPTPTSFCADEIFKLQVDCVLGSK